MVHGKVAESGKRKAGQLPGSLGTCVHGQGLGTEALVVSTVRGEPGGVVRDAENILSAHKSSVVEWKLAIILFFYVKPRPRVRVQLGA